ncbi:hypothetical protein JOQ06_030076 [Pogonophryne albipinna]|uniref:PDEase domain-containing protein n=1 Tax=Pogonophryne albipinna TaxID=1090488 RepID=A0AAD6AXG6_9TELE|nr:hypothetical protein JOQ06_030076 [Pogonophryne albipinna]
MVLIKCCDISNEVRPMEVAEPWVDCLLEEYFMQSDREKAEGLPVAPFMDREKVTKPTAQIGFIKFVLIPMFETVMKVSVQDNEDEGQSNRAANRGATGTPFPTGFHCSSPKKVGGSHRRRSHRATRVQGESREVFGNCKIAVAALQINN